MKASLQCLFAIFAIGAHISAKNINIEDETLKKDLDFDFTPKRGNMLGGSIVNITSSFFNKSEHIICKFDTADEVYGFITNETEAFCVQPLLLVEGYITLVISTETYNYTGKYYSESPAAAAQKIFFEDESYNEKAPSIMEITWSAQNLTFYQNAALFLSLWGYRETTVGYEVVYITDLASGIINTGKYTIIPSAFRNRENDDLLDIIVGFMQINTTQPLIPSKSSQDEIKYTFSIWSSPIPLAWYFEPQWERKYGQNWTNQVCDNWLQDDEYPKDFNNELLDQRLYEDSRVPRLSQWYQDVAQFACCFWQEERETECETVL